MITVFTLEHSEEWDKIVHTFSDYDVYWLSKYEKGFQIHGDGEPILFYYNEKGGKVRGINVVMKRDIGDDIHFQKIIKREKLYDFSTPYGYGGWLIEGNKSDSLFEEYENWCMSNGIISEFVRFHPLIENHILCEKGYEILSLGETVVMDLTSPEIIWKNLTSKNRNMIRKAIKNNVKIYNGRYPEGYEIFMDIYNKTMDKDEAKKYYYFEKEFYKSILEDMSENAQIFYAEVPNKGIIASSIMLIANGRMNYHLSGFLKEYSGFAATNLILYKAALWGAENGCKSLYLGGGVGSEEDNLLKFKKSFCRNNLKKFYVGKKVFDEKKYNELVDLKDGTIENKNFFPQYRG